MRHHLKMSNMNSKILTIHGGHDCSVTFIDKKNCLRTFQLERFSKIRHCSFSKLYNYTNCKSKVKTDFFEYIKTQWKEEPQVVLHSQLDKDSYFYIDKIFNNSRLIQMGHHTSHGIGAYYQSGFKDALVITMDGGGVDFNHFSISNKPKGACISYSFIKIVNNSIKVLATSNSPGAMEFTPGQYPTPVLIISEVKDPHKFGHFENLFTDDKSYISTDYLNPNAGKLMGLAAYGKVCEDVFWRDKLKKYYMLHPLNAHNPLVSAMLLKELSEDGRSFLGMEGSEQQILPDCISGQDSYDLAATNQYVFEELCFELIKPYVDNCDLDIVLSGGCALNVLFNQKLALYLQDQNRKLFISPTPGDEGLSLGHYSTFTKTLGDNYSIYSGFDILDRDKIPEYYNKYKKIGKVIEL